MNEVEKQIKAKAENLRRLIKKAQAAKAISEYEVRMPDFGDYDPEPPFVQFNNPPPPWGKG